MTQEDLKDYLEIPESDCYLYKTKSKVDGKYYFMRKNKTAKIAVLFPPKNGVYKQENVCHICNILDVEVPIWAKSAQSNLDEAKKDHENKNENLGDRES